MSDVYIDNQDKRPVAVGQCLVIDPTGPDDLVVQRLTATRVALMARHDDVVMPGIVLQRGDGMTLGAMIPAALAATLGLQLVKMSLALMELSPEGRSMIEQELAEVVMLYCDKRDKKRIDETEAAM
jgi:hypothetical protein